MQETPFIDALRPHEKQDAFIFDVILVIGAAIVIALFAQLAIRLPFSPVPITGQTFAVLLIAAVLGQNRATLAVGAYLLEGSLGLPVFANASSGLAHILGPTGGYLLGFIPSAYVTGYLYQQYKIHLALRTIAALVLGTTVIFISGLIWLRIFVGADNVLQLGFYPFLPGAIIKIALVMICLPGLRKIFKTEN
jgi:biotin transport system substrate-specific component